MRGFTPNGNVICQLGARTLVNVGSVGQPRNMRPEACYAIYNRIGALNRVSLHSL